MTGISTEPETTLPSPSGTKRDISLTTLKASLSNRGSSLVFTAPEGETTVPEASKATVAVTVADAEGEPCTVSLEDADGIAAVVNYNVEHTNRAPEYVGATELAMKVGETSGQYHFAELFNDVDGDKMTYTTSVEDASVATVFKSEDGFIVAAKAAGKTNINVRHPMICSAIFLREK